jgi:hypothetical protein
VGNCRRAASARQSPAFSCHCDARGVRTIWTVYEKPRDYPTGWIARMHEVVGAVVKPTGYVIKAVELEPIREKLARAGLVCIPRQEDDEWEIVESWI